MMTRRNKRCNHSSKATTVNVPNPGKIQYDSFGFLQQTENDPPQFVCFFSKNNPATASNNCNVSGSRNIKIQRHSCFPIFSPDINSSTTRSEHDTPDVEPPSVAYDELAVNLLSY